MTTANEDHDTTRGAATTATVALPDATGDEPPGPPEGSPQAGAVALALALGVVGLLVGVALGAAASDGRHAWTGGALGAVLVFVAVMGVLQWRSRTWLYLWLLAFGAAFVALGTANWVRLGYVLIVLALLLWAAFDATPPTLRVMAGAALAVTLVLLVRIGLAGGEREAGRLFGAADAGGEIVANDALGVLVAGEPEVDLGVAEWVVLAVLLGLAYRMLEAASARRLVGPVTVEDAVVVGGGDEGDAAGRKVTACMRDWLARADIAEPGPVPGASTAQSVVEIASADPLKSANAVATAVAAASRVLFPPTGIVATPTYERRAYATGDRIQHALTVTLKDGRSSRLLVARSFTGTDPDAVITSASAFVAQHAVARAATIPPWADWPEAGGDALVWYQRSRDATNAGERLGHLRRALAAHPSSGVLKVALGNALLVTGGAENLMLALRHYLEARLAYPRFILARYRLAAALAMLSDGSASCWRAGTGAPGSVERHLTDPADLAHLLFHARLVATRQGQEVLARGAPGPDAAGLLLEAARREIGAARNQARWWWLAWSALVRPPEREADLHVLLWTETRRRVLVGIQTSQWIVGLRQIRLDATGRAAAAGAVGGADLGTLTAHIERTVARARTSTPVGSTALYNAACFFALKAAPPTGSEGWADDDRHRAVDLLNEIRRMVPNRVLTSAWLRNDPDLRSLQGMDEFEVLKERVASDERLVAADLPVRRDDG
ncbi:MAG TPA: hypothetical protein VFZ77_06950 [Acidimicrobiales bacterium]